jgi:CNT family concentrative nucleoside transporter
MGNNAMETLQSALGLIVLTSIAWALSEKRGAVKIKVALTGIGLQVVIAYVLIKFPPLKHLFTTLNYLVLTIQSATEAGTSFVFGYLGGGPLPFALTHSNASFILAFRALPMVIVLSAITAVLTYWRILPWIVRGFAFLLEKTLGVGGAAGLGTAANIFVGMVEAPLFVRPYLQSITRSELFIIMSAGMATIGGTVLVLYATFIDHLIADATGHLLTASIISAPAAITIAKLMVPETESQSTGYLVPDAPAMSAMDAIATGTQNGLKLVLNITAMLIVLVALVHLMNAVLGLLPEFYGSAVTLERLLGYLMAPVAWLMGIPWEEANTAGALLGTKTVLNELLAYLQLAELPAGRLSERSILIMTYALCGFANFASLGIMIGGLTTIVPQRRNEVVSLGLKSLVAGTLATCCTGAVVGIFN